MKPKTLYFLIFLFALSTGIANGQTVKDTTVLDYGIVNKTLDEKVLKYGAENVLVVMDIDNTILTGDSDLGSDIWYQWQRDELAIKPNPDQKLTNDCLFNEAIAMLYELGTMSLTDSLLPGYIETWQKKGVTVFALTSRSPACRAATERELKRNRIDLSVTEPRRPDGQKLLLRDSLKNRELTYSRGIMMTSGLNKGDMLAYLLDKAGKSYKAIIFVDDTRKNIDAVKAWSTTTNNADLVLFNYTKIITDRLKLNNNMILTQEQADKMDQDWDLLIKLITTIFPERLVKSECTW